MSSKNKALSIQNSEQQQQQHPQFLRQNDRSYKEVRRTIVRKQKKTAEIDVVEEQLSSSMFVKLSVCLGHCKITDHFFLYIKKKRVYF